MIQVALTIYLTLVTLAGPWLCCCTTTRLLTRLTHSVKKEHAAKSCCHGGCRHHHRKHAGPGQDSEEKTPCQPCPCQKEQSQVVPILSLDAESARQLQFQLTGKGLLHSPASAATLVVIPDMVVLAASEHSAPPLRTSRDILLAFQTFRC